MPGISVAEAKAPKKGPKVLAHIEIHPTMGGGTNVKHVYSGHQHEPKEYQFGAGEGVRAANHISRHTGLPLNGQAEGEGEEEDDNNAEPQKAPRVAAVRGAGSMHNNARAARTEGV